MTIWFARPIQKPQFTGGCKARSKVRLLAMKVSGMSLLILDHVGRNLPGDRQIYHVHDTGPFGVLGSAAIPTSPLCRDSDDGPDHLGVE